MKNHTFYYLSNFIALTNADDVVIDNMIKTKHTYMLICTADYEALVESEKQYVGGSFERDPSTGLCKLKLKNVKKDDPEKIYELDNIDEIIGFTDFDVALNFCGEKTDCLCTEPGTKLIFSPQLVKHLLKNKYRIVDIKEKNDGSGNIVFVFLIEDGFYQCIQEWRNKKK